MKYSHDREADAIYIQLTDQPYAYGEELDPERRIDYATDGAPMGIELLCVSTGVDARDLPQRDEVEKLLARLNIKILAS
jgi:uncharacterized protein YuzE